MMALVDFVDSDQPAGLLATIPAHPALVGLSYFGMSYGAAAVSAAGKLLDRESRSNWSTFVKDLKKTRELRGVESTAKALCGVRAGAPAGAGSRRAGIMARRSVTGNRRL